MRKRLCLIACTLVLCMQPLLASAEAALTPWLENLSHFSTEELLQLQALIDEELLLRGYVQQTYILNKNTNRFHLPSCSSVSKIKEQNKITYEGERESLTVFGYEPCGNCHP